MKTTSLPDDRKWTYSLDQLFFRPSPPRTPTLLGRPTGRELQRSLSHTQNCRSRVLGGCEMCIEYKNVMLFHASKCELPIGKCGVRKCDNIRNYMKTNSLPDDSKWTCELDQFFFGPSKCVTPTSLGNGEDYFVIPKKKLVNSDDSRTPVSQSSSRNASEVWNQFHIDRPPDLPPALSASRDKLLPDFPLNVDQLSDLPVTGDRHVYQTTDLPVSQGRLPDLPLQGEEVQLSDLTATRGPITDSQVSFQHHVEEEHAMPATPLSAVCVPDVSQAAEDSAPRQVILWPLNRVMKCNILPNVYRVVMLKCFIIFR